VQGLKAKGKTVVLISHRPDIVGVADRLLILVQGSVHASGPRDGVLAALQKQREAALSALTPAASIAQKHSANDANAADGNPTSNT
jgi:ATP-binding cassette subfamily C exporter for protease/lipase